MNKYISYTMLLVAFSFGIAMHGIPACTSEQAIQLTRVRLSAIDNRCEWEDDKPVNCKGKVKNETAE